MSVTYYDILQLNNSATPDEIKKSFRKLALKYHPDKNKSHESHQIFLKVVEAYEVLSDSNSRKKYDLTLLHDKNLSQTVADMWIPPADLSSYYSYETIKNWRVIGKTEAGGIWDIGEKENLGMWKTTLALFACLATLALIIVLLSR